MKNTGKLFRPRIKKGEQSFQGILKTEIHTFLSLTIMNAKPVIIYHMEISISVNKNTYPYI